MSKLGFKIKREKIEEAVDYSKLATPAIFEMIREMESRYGKDLELNKDEPSQIPGP